MWSTRTNEGDLQHESTGNPLLDFFGKAGSAFEKRGSFYEGQSSALDLFKDAWDYDKGGLTAFKLMLWLRDCRGGAGNRSGFRSILNWMAKDHPDWIEQNIEWIPAVGRWDDLRALYGTSLEEVAAKFWWNQIANNNVLAAKWADRNKDYPVRKCSNLKIGDFRRMLANVRKNKIVEHRMCEKRWNTIDYNTVPSVAMSRYTSAFVKNDEIRFNRFKEDVKTGKTEVKTKALFPHDCVRTCKYGDREMAEIQFNNLPNYVPDDSMTMVIADTSGSMNTNISGKVTAMDISMGLALYFSNQVSPENPFYKRFIQFCSEGRLTDWRKLSFSQAVFDREIFDGAVGSTRIDMALDTILSIAKLKEIPQSLMPKNLMIISDMQFSEGCNSDESSIETALKQWDIAGYDRPKIIYWNTDTYGGSPTVSENSNTAFISGFSPSILKQVLADEDIDPMSILNKALLKYEDVKVPVFHNMMF